MKRFEVNMQPEQRRELEALARELGMSTANLARLRGYRGSLFR